MEQKDLAFIQDQIGYNFQNTDLLQHWILNGIWRHFRMSSKSCLTLTVI